MSTLRIVPETLNEYKHAGNIAKVHISQRGLLINDAAVFRLAIKKGHRFELELEDGKLFYKDSINEGFEITNFIKSGASVPVPGLLFLLQQKGVVDRDAKKAVFELGG